MRFRTLLPALCFLSLFCSSAQAQTLDDTLLKVTVFWFPGPYLNFQTNGTDCCTPSERYSITSLGLPQGSFMNVGGFSSVYYSFDSTSTLLYAHRSFPGGLTNYVEDFSSYAGPVLVLGTYPISGSYYLSDQDYNHFFRAAHPNGEITVTATPEPISGSLAAIGFAMLALRQRLGRNHVRR